jgi:hypothetical protein
MPCLTHWHIWLCHMEVGRTLVLSPSTYRRLVSDKAREHIERVQSDTQGYCFMCRDVYDVYATR